MAQYGLSGSIRKRAQQAGAGIGVGGAQGSEPALGFFLEIVEGGCCGELSWHRDLPSLVSPEVL
jgi:hypothetical protein